MHACRTIGAAALIAAFSLAGSAHAQVPESEDPIKLTLHDWTGQLITTEIMGRVLEGMGYNVEYVQADYIAQFAGLDHALRSLLAYGSQAEVLGPNELRERIAAAAAETAALYEAG